MAGFGLLRFLILFVVVFCCYSDDAVKTIRIGRCAYTSPKQVLISHFPLTRFLSKHTGYQVELKLFLTYDEIAERLDKDELDFGWLGTTFYCSRTKKQFVPALSPIWSGRKYYQGQILTRVDSDIDSLKQLRGRKMAFVSEHSSSGYIFPKLLLEQVGIKLEDLDEYAFLNSHNAVAYAVLTKQYDAGATYKGIFKGSLVKDKDQFKVLAVTGVIKNEPVVVRQGIDSLVRSKMVQAFLMATRDNCLGEIPSLTGFQVADEKDYDEVRRLMKNVE